MSLGLLYCSVHLLLTSSVSVPKATKSLTSYSGSKRPRDDSGDLDSPSSRRPRFSTAVIQPTIGIHLLQFGVLIKERHSGANSEYNSQLKASFEELNLYDKSSSDDDNPANSRHCNTGDTMYHGPPSPSSEFSCSHKGQSQHPCGPIITHDSPLHSHFSFNPITSPVPNPFNTINYPIHLQTQNPPSSPPSAVTRQLRNSPSRLSPSPTSAIAHHMRKFSSRSDDSNSHVELVERSGPTTPDSVILTTCSDTAATIYRGPGSMVSIFLKGFHPSHKIISRSSLGYSNIENGCALWIEKMKKSPSIIPQWKKWLTKHGNDEKKFVETKIKEFAHCNQILQAFILDV
jgi:hypothetical protein